MDDMWEGGEAGEERTNPHNSPGLTTSFASGVALLRTGDAGPGLVESRFVVAEGVNADVDVEDQGPAVLDIDMLMNGRCAC